MLKCIMTSNRPPPLLKGKLCRRAVCFHVLSLQEQNKSFTAFSAVTVRVRTVVSIMRPARTHAAAAGRHGTRQRAPAVLVSPAATLTHPGRRSVRSGDTCGE